MKKTKLFIVIAYLLTQSLSFGALNAYLTLVGEEQGPILGSVTQTGRVGTIMVIAYGHEVFSPRDTTSGLISNKRQHEPLRITKELDKSTPLLMNAWSRGEVMSEFYLRFYTPTTSSPYELQHYTIRLTGAQIVSIQQEMLNNKYPDNMQHKEREHVTFTYRGIEWVWTQDGGFSFDDEWRYAGAGMLISDLTGDGIVNLLDLAIFASDWLKTTR
jgi:type VI secretion system secreted protein Hcp